MVLPNGNSLDGYIESGNFKFNCKYTYFPKTEMLIFILNIPNKLMSLHHHSTRYYLS